MRRFRERTWWALVASLVDDPGVRRRDTGRRADQGRGCRGRALGIQVNLLWVVIGAVLVIFMQAGFALVETGFCRAKHAAHVVSTNFAIFGLGFVGFFFVGFAADVRRLHAAAASGMDDAVGDEPASARGNWVFLWQGGWATLRQGLRRRRRAGVLPLHGRVHGHDGDDPDRRDGRAVEVEGVRRLGPLLRRHLLPAVRRVDLGRRLARQAREHA